MSMDKNCEQIGTEILSSTMQKFATPQIAVDRINLSFEDKVQNAERLFNLIEKQKNRPALRNSKSKELSL